LDKGTTEMCLHYGHLVGALLTRAVFSANGPGAIPKPRPARFNHLPNRAMFRPIGV